MTKKEYLEYEAAFADFFEKNNFSIIGAVDDDKEPFFSWKPCEICRDSFGGNRETYVGVDKKTHKTSESFIICSDCVYYDAYGKLDDLTMLEMEEE